MKFWLVIPDRMSLLPVLLRVIEPTPCEKCPNTEFLLVHIFPYSDQKKTPYSDTFHEVLVNLKKFVIMKKLCKELKIQDHHLLASFRSPYLLNFQSKYFWKLTEIIRM